MSGTNTDRQIRLCVPQGRVDTAGLSLEGLSRPLAESDIDGTGVDAIEVAFEDVENTEEAISILEEFTEEGRDVRIEEFVVEIRR
jgi:hypothetical protein